MPRVIAGEVGGIPLQAPAGDQTRPTLDRTKEAVFSAVTARIDLDQTVVLDLFAGSGQLGIEALSRGAKAAIFVEKNAAARTVIKQNLAKTKLEANGRIWAMDCHKAVARCLEQGFTFDLVLIDPPYLSARKHFERLCEAGLGRILSDSGLVVLEYSSRESVIETVKDLQPIKHCKYGSAMVSFYRC